VLIAPLEFIYLIDKLTNAIFEYRGESHGESRDEYHSASRGEYRAHRGSNLRSISYLENPQVSPFCSGSLSLRSPSHAYAVNLERISQLSQFVQ
jgi:hypothetical protein